MKKLSKKGWIILGSISAPVAAFAIGVPVAISMVDHEKQFVVSLYSANAPRYFVTDMDPQQNRPKVSKIDIWDIDQKNNLEKDKVADELGIGSTFVVATLNKTSVYENGLEKFINDLINIKNNDKDVTLLFRSDVTFTGQKTEGGSTDPSYGFTLPLKSFLLKDFPTKTKVERATQLRTWIDNMTKLEVSQVDDDPIEIKLNGNVIWNSDQGIIDETESGALMFLAAQAVKLVKSDSQVATISFTTEDEIKKAFNKVKNALKIAGVPDLTN